jgi:hypothetical protein
MGVILSLFLGVIPAFVYATFVYWLDRYEKEPVMLLGGVLDGIVYAGIAALGFAATENSFYIFSYGYQEAGYEGIMVLACVRNILVGWQHPFYTAFIGIGLATARLNRHTLIKIAAPIAGWGLAVITHSFHNTFATLIGGVEGLLLGTVIDWTGWFFMLVVIIWVIFLEQKYLRKYLKDEVSLGTLTQNQFKTACSAFSMSLARMNSLTSGNYGKTNKFYHLCAELAHKKRQREAVGEELGNTALIQQIRGELAQLSPEVGV